MSNEYLVTAYETMRITYIVPADTPEEAKAKLEANEESYPIAYQEYHDRESIDKHVEENL